MENVQGQGIVEFVLLSYHTGVQRPSQGQIVESLSQESLVFHKQHVHLGVGVNLEFRIQFEFREGWLKIEETEDSSP